MTPLLEGEITKFRRLIDADLQTFSEAWLRDWRERYGAVTADTLEVLVAVLTRGGKRLRGVLAMKSYYAHGGRDETVAIGAARVVELVQAYLLVLDDIADNSDMRRGGPSAHKLLERWHAEHGWRGDPSHFGRSQATNVASLGMHQATLELADLPVDPQALARATITLNKNISVTAAGQIADINNEVIDTDLGEADIIATLERKTAYYTFVSPLELGACLAGREGLSEALRAYALGAGVAFQVIDDVLGVFGDEFESGKSAEDDIREGKATVLSNYAQRHASGHQAVQLAGTLGNPYATPLACEGVRRIFEATGARLHAAAVAEEYADTAREALRTVELGDEDKLFLEELLGYVMSRNK